MAAVELSSLIVPGAAWLFGAVVGRLAREHNHDKRITKLENCLDGRNGIYDQLEKIDEKLENISQAVTARHADLPYSGNNKRGAQHGS